MGTLKIDYSESMLSVINLSPESFEEEAKMALAMKLFEIGRFTSGQASSLAGISKVQFLRSCKKFETASVEWDEEELDAEFENTAQCGLDKIMKFAAVIEKSQDGYGAFVPDIPRCVAVGDSVGEVEHLITEAIEFHLKGIQEDGELVPPPVTKYTN